MKILAVGAHADDVELGCGGALVKWAKDGHEIMIHVATDSAYGDPDGNPVRSAEDARAEAESSAARLGARLHIGDFPCFTLGDQAAALGTALAGLTRDYSPDILLAHWDGDSHADHRALALAARHAARRVPTVLAYRSNWYPGARAFEPRVIVDITDTLDEKLSLVRLFASENGRTGGAWGAQLRREAEYLGFAHGLDAAEGFEAISVRL